jgi:hypothetical protein
MTSWSFCRISRRKWTPQTASPTEAFKPCSWTGVQALFVDHDYYSPQWSLINVDGSTIRLLLIENFDGTAEEYADELAARNKRIQDEDGAAADGRSPFQ